MFNSYVSLPEGNNIKIQIFSLRSLGHRIDVVGEALGGDGFPFPSFGGSGRLHGIGMQ